MAETPGGFFQENAANDIRAISIAEVKELLIRLSDKSESRQGKDEESFREIYRKTKEYAIKFSPYPSQQAASDVGRLVEVNIQDLSKFEITSLANLCPNTVEEAVAFIPSLEERAEQDPAGIENLLEEFKSLKNLPTEDDEFVVPE